MLVRTDLRNHPTETARNISYDPTAPLTALDVQSALEQVQAEVVAPRGITSTTVTFAQSPYTPLITDSMLLVDTTGGPVTIALPLGSSRVLGSGAVTLTVKDDVGNSDVNAISVTRAGADLIDGLTSYPIDTKYAAVTFLPKAGGYDAI